MKFKFRAVNSKNELRKEYKFLGGDLMSASYQICTRCIMDTTDPEIQFDQNGVCSHCQNYDEQASKELHYDQAGQQELQRLVEKIKKDGRKKSTTVSSVSVEVLIAHSWPTR